MIVVLDTNVIVSALLTPAGIPAELINRWEAQDFDVTVSPAMLEELNRALGYEKVKKVLNFSSEQIDRFVLDMQSVAVVVEPEMELDLIQSDPEDNRVVECALTARAGFIITGDSHLLELEEHRGIVFLSPEAFLSILGSPGVK